MADPLDQHVRYFRAADRIFRMNGNWFFASREGDLGPFPSREKAEIEAQTYVQRTIATGTAPLSMTAMQV
jgi:hypothetical protein